MSPYCPSISLLEQFVLKEQMPSQKYVNMQFSIHLLQCSRIIVIICSAEYTTSKIYYSEKPSQQLHSTMLIESKIVMFGTYSSNFSTCIHRHSAGGYQIFLSFRLFLVLKGRSPSEISNNKINNNKPLK